MPQLHFRTFNVIPHLQHRDKTLWLHLRSRGTVKHLLYQRKLCQRENLGTVPCRWCLGRNKERSTEAKHQPRGSWGRGTVPGCESLYGTDSPRCTVDAGPRAALSQVQIDLPIRERHKSPTTLLVLSTPEAFMVARDLLALPVLLSPAMWELSATALVGKTSVCLTPQIISKGKTGHDGATPVLSLLAPLFGTSEHCSTLVSGRILRDGLRDRVLHLV